MLQVVHDAKGGKTRILQVPDPLVGAGQILVGTMRSIISAGTERYVIQLAQSNLVSKARQRPDHVRRIIQKLRAEGLVSTFSQVRAKLNEPLALGYSAAGIVLGVGSGVHDLKPGDRVAVAGPHAAVISAGRNMCAQIPTSVSLEDAAYAPLGAIALQGVRLANVDLGSRVLVVGLGLLGLITVGLLRSSGCRVWGVDLDSTKANLAQRFGAVGSATPASQQALLASAGPDGFDAVIITAASKDNSTIQLAAEVVRPRGRVVAVGLVGLDIPREPFFRKEIELTVSHSLGIGRGNARYESSSEDYPIGQARWTVRRNIETVLSAIEAGTLPVGDLTTHNFDVKEAGQAYDLITANKQPYLGVALVYDESSRARTPRVALRASTPTIRDQLRVSLVGGGNFARLVMLPKLASIRGVSFQGLCTAKGLNASDTGSRYQFSYSTADLSQILQDADTDAVIIATRHNLHAEQVIAVLRSGKHVFVEKPLCLTVEELLGIEDAVAASSSLLMVGFNRRYSTASALLEKEFAGIRPLSVSYRFAVPELPMDSWVQDSEIGGGRVIGEACHAIDLCSMLAGSPPVRVFSESAGTGGTLASGDDRAFITMRHRNGSISNVSYQSGGDRTMPSERIEVIGGGKSAVLDNWKTLSVWANGRQKITKIDGGKGHDATLEAFVAAALSGGQWPIPWDSLRESSLAAILAERSAREGLPFDMETHLLGEV